MTAPVFGRIIRRILVPLDGSSFGEAALRPALDLARRTGGELRLLSVLEPDWFPTTRALTPGFRTWREEYLAGVAPNWPGVDLTTVVREGSADDEILAEAESWSADVIVMSTHGRGAVSKVWLGSVADACLRRSRRPVLLVRSRPAAQIEGVSFLPLRLVVPLDGSMLAEGALSWATALAESFGATVSIVRVVAPPTPGLLERASSEERVEAPQETARSYLQGISRRLRSRGLSVSTDVIVGAHPAHAIIGHAGGDLVVMATHSRSPLQRVLLGSVTDKVVRGARGHVFAIPEASAIQGREGLAEPAVDDERPSPQPLAGGRLVRS